MNELADINRFELLQQKVSSEKNVPWVLRIDPSGPLEDMERYCGRIRDNFDTVELLCKKTIASGLTRWVVDRADQQHVITMPGTKLNHLVLGRIDRRLNDLADDIANLQNTVENLLENMNPENMNPEEQKVTSTEEVDDLWKN